MNNTKEENRYRAGQYTKQELKELETSELLQLAFEEGEPMYYDLNVAFILKVQQIGEVMKADCPQDYDTKEIASDIIDRIGSWIHGVKNKKLENKDHSKLYVQDDDDGFVYYNQEPTIKTEEEVREEIIEEFGM